MNILSRTIFPAETIKVINNASSEILLNEVFSRSNDTLNYEEFEVLKKIILKFVNTESDHKMCIVDRDDRIIDFNNFVSS